MSSFISNKVETELLTLQQVHERKLGFLIPSYQPGREHTLLIF